MTTLALQARVARLSWQPSRVTNRADRAERRALMRSGALIRTIARRSIRHRKTGRSAPGGPPFSRDPQKRYKRIQFSYDRRRHSVVTGHVALSRQALPLPAQLEGRGGVRRVLALPPSQRRRRFRRGQRVVIKTVAVRPRPATGPAFEKARPRFAEFWRDSV